MICGVKNVDLFECGAVDLNCKVGEEICALNGPDCLILADKCASYSSTEDLCNDDENFNFLNSQQQGGFMRDVCPGIDCGFSNPARTPAPTSATAAKFGWYFVGVAVSCIGILCK